MNLSRKIVVGTALSGVLAMACPIVLQAEDLPGGTTMKPLYAISFDVGAKHVLSYFLKKEHKPTQNRIKQSRFLCDLTVMVTEKPAKDPEGSRILTLSTTKFRAEIDGGGARMVGFDTAAGGMLEYGCTPGAQAMTVRQVDPAPKIAHPPLYPYDFHHFHGTKMAGAVGG
jgi:hypothetical protein